MRKELILAVLMALLCLGLNGPDLQAQGGGGPKMVFQEKSFAFGEVDEGRKLEHTFTVSNRGESPLEIKKVKPG